MGRHDLEVIEEDRDQAVLRVDQHLSVVCAYAEIALSGRQFGYGKCGMKRGVGGADGAFVDEDMAALVPAGDTFQQYGGMLLFGHVLLFS
jgi:hypothetical protein